MNEVRNMMELLAAYLAMFRSLSADVETLQPK